MRLARMDCRVNPGNDENNGWFSRRPSARVRPTPPRTKIDSPPPNRREAKRRGACQPLPPREKVGAVSASLFRVRGGCAPRRQVYAVCALICLRGAPAFRRYAAALARANASAVGSAPVPAFPETRSGGRYPLRSVSSLPRSAETGRGAGRAVAQSRPAPRQ